MNYLQVVQVIGRTPSLSRFNRRQQAKGQSLWEMNQILLVWNARNDVDKSNLQVFETSDGQKLVEYGLNTVITELKFESVAYKFKH